VIGLSLPFRPTPRPQARSFSSYQGAMGGRLVGDWNAPYQSANNEVRWNNTVLRRRARAEDRNNPHVRRFCNLIVKNVVGSKGILLEVQAQTTRGDPHTNVNAAIEDAWKEWGRKENASANGRLSWIGIQALCAHTWAREGEVFVRLLRGFDNPFGFALQLVDPDQVDELYNVEKLPNGNRIVMGVELDTWDRQVAFHVWSKHPTEFLAGPRVRERIPADQILHLDRPLQYGAARSATPLAPVLWPMHNRKGFVDSATTNARVGASKQGWIKRGPEADEVLDATRSIPMDANPGAIDELRHDEELVMWDPAFPSESFGPFNNALLHYEAAGLDVAATSLSGDLSMVNYSSIRAGLLDERDTYRQLQGWMIESLHDPVYRIWLQQAVLTGMVKIPATDVSRWFDVVWRSRGWAWVDPFKEVQAAKLSESYGFRTMSQITGDHGGDYEKNLVEFQHEAKLREKYGVTHAEPISVTIPEETTNVQSTDSAQGGRTGAPNRPRDGRPRLAVATG